MAEVALEEVVVMEVDMEVVLVVATAVDLEEEVDMAAVVALEVDTEVVDLVDMAILVAMIIILAPAVMAMVYPILVAGKYWIMLNIY